MKTTRETLRISLENVGFSITDAEVLYNWSNLSSYIGSAPTTYIFNNAKTLEDTFVDHDTTQSQPSTRANLGVNKGTTTNAIENVSGYGTFNGTDLIKLSVDQELTNWSVIINFKYTGCPSNKDKRAILMHNYSSTSNTGFKIGVNGLKNLFFEYYDTSGNLETHTIEKVLHEESIIGITHNGSTKITNLHIYNPLDFSKTSKSILSTNSIAKGNEWYIGGLIPAFPSASAFDQMFIGEMYEFMLFNKTLGEDCVQSVFDSTICSSITEDSINTVSESYFAPVSFTSQQVQIGTKVTGYTPSATTITDGNGVANTFYDETPITEPVYETQTVYTDSSTPSSRNVQQLVEGAKTFDYTYIRDYSPSCLLLKSPDGITSYDYQINTHSKYNSNLNKKAIFYEGDNSFNLEEDYGSTKKVNIYINGLLVESGVDYTRTNKKITKYTGNYTDSDTCIYDVIENGTSHFEDFLPSSGDADFVGKGGHEVFLDGKKLIEGTDYTNINSGQDIRVLASQVAEGRLGIISKDSGFLAVHTGTITTFVCPSLAKIISETLWLDGIRKTDEDYLLNNACDLANSTTVVAEKTTVIYENQTDYYNI